MIRNKKTVLIMGLLLCVTTLNIVARNKKPAEEFKNLKVYPKDISEARLDADMHLFSRSLGVKCGYCHIKEEGKWNFASDSLHKKEEARAMMRMTNDLNEKYFGADLKTAKPTDLAMNCYTCHRGEEHPVVPWDTINVKPVQAPISPWNKY
ncbi:MAG: c-type cytochrome [Bacteroidota bacterium]